ncbi:unnamed protein product, partial [Coregonus sp. 'balchen']
MQQVRIPGLRPAEYPGHMNVPAMSADGPAQCVTPEVMAPILSNSEVQQRLLPSGESLPQSAEDVQNLLTSPQFCQLGPLMNQFGLPSEAVEAGNEG